MVPVKSHSQHLLSIFLSEELAKEYYIRSADGSLSPNASEKSSWKRAETHEHACCKTHCLAHSLLCTYPCRCTPTVHTPTHVQTQTHLSPLHNAIGSFAHCFLMALLQRVCAVHCTVGKTYNKLNVSVLHESTRARTHTHLDNTILPVVFSTNDSDSSPHQQCVYGVGENWNASYCSFSV